MSVGEIIVVVSDIAKKNRTSSEHQGSIYTYQWYIKAAYPL